MEMPIVVKNYLSQLISCHSFYFCVMDCILLHSFEHQILNWLAIELTVVKN